jgi:hypothetical protein
MGPSAQSRLAQGAPDGEEVPEHPVGHVEVE